jgi:hypothetical protein
MLSRNSLVLNDENLYMFAERIQKDSTRASKDTQSIV